MWSGRTLAIALRCKGQAGLPTRQRAGKMREKSAEAVVVWCRRINRLRHSPERGETVGLADPGTAKRRAESFGARSQSGTTRWA